jgi:hypothetical protein
LLQINLQRDTIDVGGSRQLIIGKLPDGVNNSSLTWVPVRLYSESDGGLSPPEFAPNQVSLCFKETTSTSCLTIIDSDVSFVSHDHLTRGQELNPNTVDGKFLLEGVYLDGQKLADSTVPEQGVNSTSVSALIDTVSLVAYFKGHIALILFRVTR